MEPTNFKPTPPPKLPSLQIHVRYDNHVETIVVRKTGHSVPQLQHYLKTLFPELANFNVTGLAPIVEDIPDSEHVININALAEAAAVVEDDGFYELTGWMNPEIPVASAPVQQPAQQPVQEQQQQQQQTNWYNDPWQNFEYFHSYSKLGIHGEMIKDKARTGAYKKAIETHAADFKDKVVLDLGTGTGILAMFAAKAGAKRVYAVEASDLASWTEVVIQSNGFGNVIQVLKGRMEELKLPEKESMLETLLDARDLYLKPNGLMFPATGNLFLAPICIDDYYSEKVSFWTDTDKMWGLDMSILLPYAKKCAFEKPIIDTGLEEKHQLAEGFKVKSFDFATVPKHEPYDKTVVPFSFKIQREGRLHGFAAWFDVTFSGSDPSKESILLSTSPASLDTHWHQLMLIFDSTLLVKEGYTVVGTLRYQRNPDLLRHLIFDINYVVKELGEGFSKTFYLWGNE